VCRIRKLKRRPRPKINKKERREEGRKGERKGVRIRYGMTVIAPSIVNRYSPLRTCLSYETPNQRISLNRINRSVLYWIPRVSSPESCSSGDLCGCMSIPMLLLGSHRKNVLAASEESPVRSLKAARVARH
jgi:hypothetical protein